MYLVFVTMSAVWWVWDGIYDVWQFEKTGPHRGDWGRLPAALDHPFRVNGHIRITMPHFVTASAEGIVRIISSEIGDIGNAKLDGTDSTIQSTSTGLESFW